MENIISTRTKAIISKYISYISAAVAIIVAIAATGKSDFYAEIGKAVPGNMDMKMLMASVAFLALSILSMKYFSTLDINKIFDIELLPVYADFEISNITKKDISFEEKINICLDKFYNKEYGYLSVGDIMNNKKSIKSGKGDIIGQYDTDYGVVVIITDSKRTSTKIMFEENYYEYAM